MLTSWAFVDSNFDRMHESCHSDIVYIAGALQMYEKTLVQKRSAQCSSRQIDTQSWLLLRSFGSPGYHFTNPSVLLSDVQMNVPSSSKSFPPIQYLQHFHHSGKHKDDRNKWTWWSKQFVNIFIAIIDIVIAVIKNDMMKLYL